MRILRSLTVGNQMCYNCTTKEEQCTQNKIKTELLIWSDKKLALKDQLQFETKTASIIRIEEELYEIDDTIKKLTQPVRPA